ncbi:SDR family NAD(P)-dependent oxidoreductase [Nocardioides sp. NPDC004968]|uniref:SDR family NAD(P)-dependent oxidoreductase n=1 Tax=Nocardioides sp. NPDC004968 TaxID=3155894 RepID=UPI0033AD1039
MLEPEVLKNRTAVVTGAASGIGAALAAELGAHGMAVVVADIDVEGAHRTAAALEERGTAALAVRVDTSDADSVQELAEAAYATFGSVELVCNNAGVLTFGNVADSPVDDWRWLSSVNVEGLLNSVHAFVPRMRTQSGWRHIMNTASTHAFLPDPGYTGLYSATKQAVVAISRGLRQELAPEGIDVTLLCPGQVASRILDSQRNRPERFGPNAAEPFGTGVIPIGTIEPEEVARQAVTGLLAGAEVTFALGESSVFREQVATWSRIVDQAIVVDRAVTGSTG